MHGRAKSIAEIGIDPTREADRRVRTIARQSVGRTRSAGRAVAGNLEGISHNSLKFANSYYL